MEYIFEYFLELVECKFARNGLTNWKTFLTNIVKNIIWHLFAGESHQVVKITVTYCQCKGRNSPRFNLSILQVFNTVESEGRQIKQCRIKNNKKSQNLK
jgi:hypothetical protein